MVPDQELERADEADMRQAPGARRRACRQLWRTEAREAPRARRDRAFENSFGTMRQRAREDSCLGVAVADLLPDSLAGFRRPGASLERLPALAYAGLAGCAHRGERDRADARARGFGAARRALHEKTQQGLEPVVA